MLKKIATYVTVAALGAALFASTQALSQEGQEPPGPNTAEFMKLYEKLSMPGPEHARFKESAGIWHTETKMWMGPGEPSISTGTSKMETIFGGRYLKETFRCTLTGTSFEGLGLTGYDNVKKKYVSIWLDNLGTGIIVTEGTYDEATETTTFVGEYDDPLAGRKKMKNVLREITKDRYVFEMYQVGSDGQEQKGMEITYTRQSS